jgi:hypothetical protein
MKKCESTNRDRSSFVKFKKHFLHLDPDPAAQLNTDIGGSEQSADLSFHLILNVKSSFVRNSPFNTHSPRRHNRKIEMEAEITEEA